MKYRPAISFMRDHFGGRDVIGAEVGVSRGKHAMSIVEALNIAHLYLIDIWQPYMQTTPRAWHRTPPRQRFDNRGAYSLVVRTFRDSDLYTIMRLLSIDAAACIDDASLDFVYIDANHDYEHVVADIAAWQPKIKPGGVLAGHDYGWEGVLRAVGELTDTGLHVYHEDNDWWVKHDAVGADSSLCL